MYCKPPLVHCLLAPGLAPGISLARRLPVSTCSANGQHRIYKTMIRICFTNDPYIQEITAHVFTKLESMHTNTRLIYSGAQKDTPGGNRHNPLPPHRPPS